MQDKPSLFGIEKSNRDFSDAYYWGKNQFNSSFPVALACYMRAHGKKAVYVRYDKKQRTRRSELSVQEVFGSTLQSEDLYFSFETRYEPFRKYVHDELPAIDLVVCEGGADKQVRPLEIKLTTLPDNTTEALAEDQYGAELVIRSATTRYMALSMADLIDRNKKEILREFDPVAAQIRDWDSKTAMLKHAKALMVALSQFLDRYSQQEVPLLVQPIWKTKGKSSVLADDCLDIFVWSNFALTRLFIDSAQQAMKEEKITRHVRTALRLARFVYELAAKGKVFQQPIFDGMTYDLQNDKEFAVSGNKTRTLMSHERLVRPAILKSEIRNIILGGGQKFLSPERRFDAILYFSNDLFEAAP